MKSRSSTGVGQKIDLEYNIETMRITDAGEQEEGFSKKPTSSFMEQIKAKSNIKSESTDKLPGATDAWEKSMSTVDDSVKITADVQSAKLKQLLGQIRQI
jgi:SET domain-containing protein